MDNPQDDPSRQDLLPPPPPQGPLPPEVQWLRQLDQASLPPPDDDDDDGDDDDSADDGGIFHVDSVTLTRLKRLLNEKVKRSIEAVRIYEPLPVQKAFHRSLAPERVLRGSNQSGKTCAAAVELALAVSGQHPTAPAEDGIAFVVGKNGDHIGRKMYRTLFRAGAFQILRDKRTGMWRAYRPYRQDDLKRAREAKLAPPLIPPRLIKEIAWVNKKENWPNVVRLHNGWEIFFFTSLGKPPQGDTVDWVWFDEEIVDPEWYPEMAARLIKKRGRFVWSATPQAGTDQLYAMHERAEDEAQLGLNNVHEFIVLLEDNKHVSDADRKAFESKLTEEQRMVRVGGEFVLMASKVFPEYQANRSLMEVPVCDIPLSWTRYLSIDPGRQVCAVLFLAVPRPDRGDFVYLYDELYIPNCDAQIFGDKMANKCKGQHFEAFLIDHQGARVTDTGGGRTIEDQYADALRKHRVACEITGCQFTWGDPSPEAGVEAIRHWLKPRPDGTTRLRYFADRVPNFIWEMKHYRYKRLMSAQGGSIVLDKPEDRGRVHQMANLRYLALYEPKWVRPKAGKGVPFGSVLAFRAKQARMNDKKESYVSLGPKG